ncbi:MAG: methylmalonyl-CoA mutase family protein, partial [Thermoplasmata archaeon]|nr:methylmalonyl-CoA mutase family protein [Thermoplasmata archaeon]
IQEASFQYQRRVDSGDLRIVGVNAYAVNEPVEVPRLRISEQARIAQSKRLRHLRSRRNGPKHLTTLDALRRVAEKPDANTMPAVLAALRARATLGEIVHAFQDVFGAYRERSLF